MQRTESRALPLDAASPLAARIGTLRTAANARHDSGFLLLDGPQAAYGSRLALIQAAQRSIDLQYYTIHADASTERLMSALREAAGRGVRVRILLDDFHSTGRDALVMELAFVPGIEMRMFNPLSGARASMVARVLSSLEDPDRIQQRMHNKLFIADNAMAVTGGRNLGDSYFGASAEGNFVDLDILAAGPIVADLSRSFDDYWNDVRSYPARVLVSQEEIAAIRRAQDNAVDGSTEAAPTAAQRAQAWDRQPLDLARLRLEWAPAVVLADKPAKIAPVDENAAGADDRPALVVTQQAARSSSPALDQAADRASGSATLVEGLLQLIGLARTDLLVISPYFVPGPDMMLAFEAAQARGVRVRVLTNSLASNDAPLAHAGYARHRKALLRAGVELYELRSVASVAGGPLGSTGASGGAGSSRSMLHSKALVLDRDLLVVGSMNLDLRSDLQNTELALLIRSPALARQAADQITRAMQQDAWAVQLQADGLLWRPPRGSNLAPTTTEPDAPASLRWLIKLLGPLAPDRLL